MTKFYGYAGKILRVDLTGGSITCIPTMDYADRFIGGSGVAAKIYWDEVSPEVSALAPENRLMFMNGPLAGFTGLAGSRWIVCGKSPGTSPEQFSLSNLGGRWGAQLKFAGYDGIVVQGKADKPVYLFIADDVVEIRDAAGLWGKGAVTTRKLIKERSGDGTAVAACGPAGENLVVFAGILADNDASGSSGLGAVMGSKNLKAVAVRGSGVVTAADPRDLGKVKAHARELWQGLHVLGDRRSRIGRRKKDPCFGCFGHCPRAVRELADGVSHKVLCGPPAIFHAFAAAYYDDMKQRSASEVPLRASLLLDDYGLDAFAMMNILFWLMMGSKTGVFTEKNTGLPLSSFGSLDFYQTLMKIIAFREGFGDLLARGIGPAADSLGGSARDLLTVNPGLVPGPDGRATSYCPRAFPAHGLLYALDPSLRMQQLHEMGFLLNRWQQCMAQDSAAKGTIYGTEGSHVDSRVFRKIAKRFWGSEEAADFTTSEGKAGAAIAIQNRSWIKESLIVCDYLFPILTTAAEDYVGDPAVESRLYSVVTGREIDEAGLARTGERIFNLRRAIALRERGARESDRIPEAMFTTGLAESGDNPDCLAPGREGEVISLKGAVVDREKFEEMKTEYYQLRGWDAVSGIPARETLDELDLQDIAGVLQREGYFASFAGE